VTLALPFEDPKQVTLVTVLESPRSGGCVIVTDPFTTQPILSSTVKEYVPAGLLDKREPVTTGETCQV
jgi:hypothetical protein